MYCDLITIVLYIFTKYQIKHQFSEQMRGPITYVVVVNFCFYNSFIYILNIYDLNHSKLYLYLNEKV